MENKIKILALFGKSAAGKDDIQNWILKYFPDYCNKIVSCTTRPPREGEIDGENYFFITKEEFIKKVVSNSMLEQTQFRDWLYGTSISQLDENKINIGVFNLAGVRTLLKNPSIEVIPVLVYADDKVRLMRSLRREPYPDCSEICRRYFADAADFEGELNFDYFKWFNNNEYHAAFDYRYTQLQNILITSGWAKSNNL